MKSKEKKRKMNKNEIISKTKHTGYTNSSIKLLRCHISANTACKVDNFLCKDFVHFWLA